MLTALLLLATVASPFEDRTYRSAVFGGERHYRVFLPEGYAKESRRYPVIYYFHGHSDRYTLERYDGGKDTAPKIAQFVAANPVIVVAADGYVAEHYTGFYGGTPYDVMQDGGKYDFGEAFKELTAHIDATLRTIPDRRHRGTSGLSMGGFMSLYLSARYPEMVGSASAFNPGPQFYAGEAGRRVLWRLPDHSANHSKTMVRLVRASGDYISQYHEEMREAYARNEAVDFEFRQDEYHRHWATSIAETFAFHMRAFANPALNNTPETFDHASAQARFSVWGWEFSNRAPGVGYTVVQGVSQSGLRVETRRWAPDGPPVPGAEVMVTTPPVYRAGAAYTVLEGEARRVVNADATGRLRFTVDGAGRQIGITGPGAGAQLPVLLPVGRGDVLRVRPGVETPLPVRVFNPRTEAMQGVAVELESDYPTVELLTKKTTIAEIPAGGAVDLSKVLRARFTAGDGDYAAARIRVKMAAGWPGASDQFDVLIAPDGAAAPVAYEILDGRAMTFRVFLQKGNQGGGAAIERRVTEGKGNGNGVLEPGEEATIWVKLAQGLDPFDKGNWHRARVYCESPWLEETERMEEAKQREWTGAKELTSVVRMTAEAPGGAVVGMYLRTESWSFHFTPDVRYGAEPLYQAFQLHRGHVNYLELKVPAR